MIAQTSIGGIKDILLPIAILLFFIIFFIAFSLYTYLKLKKKVGQVENALETIEKNDPIWRKEHLIATVRKIFGKVIKAWNTQERDKLKLLLSENLYASREKILDRMAKVQQKNVIEDVIVDEILLVDVKDYTDDSQDRFTARIKYTALNYTKDFRGNWTKPSWGEDVDSNPDMDSKEYIEFWTFLRYGDTWRLARVEKEWREGDYVDMEPLIKDEKYMDVEDI